VLAPAKYVLDRAAMALADEVTFISRRTAVEMLGPERGTRAPVVYNAVPETTLGGDPADPIELLYVGTAGHRKRTDALPGILERVRASIPDARLRIVGFDWDRDPRLKAEFQARELLAAVVCEGPVPSGELGRFYSAAGALVVPSAYEGLPMVIMEAMRAGLPCVATDVGGTAELITDGVNGFLVDVDDEEALADRCIALLTDSEAGTRMRRAAQESSARFDIGSQTTEYLEVYEILGARVEAP
jgi:glycosyltransferase involved in cell wall biosynthesis